MVGVYYCEYDLEKGWPCGHPFLVYMMVKEWLVI